ncbi:zinc finger protein 518A isoform X1 [Conger conger]|uniref:zinc finger protein 518A isoform X1 n=1 Tax=Conger conger TaxID=82655 RepID=UPI002A5A4085|nr:zinc finger protein 518A isoform X1 [Conger conger]XP_061084926.1 zinc finger protein 518A isoform X1 [Conger conger]XP_061084927.1 zinc finger protein 518A isoform X1 [Conger conger]
MEADHTAQDDPPEGSEEVEKEDPGNWRKRLRLKQVAVQLPVIQNIDEGYGAEESEEGLEKNKVQTARKSFKRPPLRGQDVAPGPGISGKILRFSCSECTGQATFSPNDLLKHFQGVHQGSLPTFPCDMCSFVTHDFSSLQRHRIGHRDTFVRCDICNDGIQYTLLQLTRHFNMFHSLNGFYCCEKCKFSTKDVGTFVQHTHRHNDALYKCSKCQHISHGSGEHQKHILTHSGPYPFSCQFCDYGAPRKDYVAKHMAAVHREEMERLNKRRASEDGQKTLVNSTPGLKLLLTKNPARQTHWMSKGLHALSGGGLLDEYGRLANPEKTLEETQQFLERTVAAQRDCKKWAKGLKSEQQYTSQTVPATAQPKQEPAVSPNAGFLNPNSNGLTVLMVKNKITIPPNCTTKVMGFKMVDGKKHLVLKVIPSAKQEPCAKTEDSLVATSVASASSVAEKEADDNALEPCKGEANTLASSEEGTGPPSGHLDSSNSEVPPNPKVSPNGVAPPGSPCSLPSRMENIDIASALVQVQAQENGEQEQELVSTTAREVEEEQPPGATENDDDAAPSPPSSPAANAVSLVSKVTEQSSLIQCEDDGSPNGETSSPIPVATDPSLEKNTPKHTDPDEFDPSPNFLESTAIECMSSKSPLSSPSQEVFTFHNYSKDTSSLSSDASLLSDEQQSTQLLTVESENDGVHILRPSHDSNLTLESLPLQVLQNRLEDQDRIVEPCVDLPEQRLLNSDPPSMEKVPDNEIEVDECVATVEVEGDTKESEVKCQNLDSSEGLNATLDSKFQCQEQCSEPPSIDGGAKVGKGEEHLDSPSESQEHSAKNVEGPNVADGEKASGSSNNAAILGKILEEHSDAIISQQLEKERIGTAVPHEAIRTPTTTLRILQPLNLSDGKQQVFLQTAENGYAVPVQLRGSPGFKLITGSVPPINVSHLKPGGERSTNRTAALTFTLSNGRIGTAAQVVGDKEAGDGLAKGGGQDSTALSPSAQQGSGTSTSSFLLNSSPLKGPLFLSSPIQSLSKERTANAPTCYLVQRPVASAAAKPSTGTASAAGNVQTPQSKPVLALPVNSPDQPTVLQTGRQAFLLRYVSPVKSGILLNSPEGKMVNQNSLTSESGGSRFILKIVRNSSDAGLPSCSGVAGGGFTAQTHANQPIYLATTGGLQSPYLLMSSNQSILNVSAGTKTSESQDFVQTLATASPLLSFSSIAPTQGKASEKHGGEGLACKLKKARLPSPRRSHQGAKRKRSKKPSMEDSLESPAKARRLSSKKSKEKEAPAVMYWEPAPREEERTLRLLPLSTVQPVKCPRRNQPVVVLNHPDADIPEVASLMRTVNKFRGEVTKVALSQRTVAALSELDCSTFRQDRSANCHPTHGRRVRPEGTVRERFILKLRLKKTSRNKYKVVNTSSDSTEWSSTFSCWFCGRIFDNQEEWIGHGQRHLMEATRDWNKLFS